LILRRCCAALSLSRWCSFSGIFLIVSVAISHSQAFTMGTITEAYG
jgi:hypothetical protein